VLEATEAIYLEGDQPSPVTTHIELGHDHPWVGERGQRVRERGPARPERRAAP